MCAACLQKMCLQLDFHVSRELFQTLYASSFYLAYCCCFLVMCLVAIAAIRQLLCCLIWYLIPSCALSPSLDCFCITCCLYFPAAAVISSALMVFTWKMRLLGHQLIRGEKVKISPHLCNYKGTSVWRTIKMQVNAYHIESMHMPVFILYI